MTRKLSIFAAPAVIGMLALAGSAHAQTASASPDSGYWQMAQASQPSGGMSGMDMKSGSSSGGMDMKSGDSASSKGKKSEHDAHKGHTGSGMDMKDKDKKKP